MRLNCTVPIGLHFLYLALTEFVNYYTLLFHFHFQSFNHQLHSLSSSCFFLPQFDRSTSRGMLGGSGGWFRAKELETQRQVMGMGSGKAFPIKLAGVTEVCKNWVVLRPQPPEMYWRSTFETIVRGLFSCRLPRCGGLFQKGVKT